MSRRSLFGLSALFLGVLLWSVAPLWSQATSSGAVSGQVTDQSGGVIPGAEVVLVDTGTQEQLKTTSNAAGRFIIINVPSGHYVLKVTHEGFTSSNTSNIEVTIGANIVVNAQLKVGSTKETVTVEAQTITELQTSNATIGSTIDSKSIQLLPNLGRDVSTLAVLQPAVTSSGYVAGAHREQDTYSIDGGNNTDDMSGDTIGYQTNFTGMGGSQTNGVASGVVPTPIESIEEVKVSVSGQGIDFNNSTGSNVQMVTKRGTSQFHGAAYGFYFSTDVGAANSWANDHTPDTALHLPYTPIVSNHRNRDGFAVGGPVLKRKIMGGSTYFFFNYEVMHFPNVAAFERPVPTAALEAGVVQVQNSSGVAQVVNGVSYPNGAYIPYNLNPYAVTVPVQPGQPATAFAGTIQPAICPGGPCDPRGLGISPIVQTLWTKYMPPANDFTGASGDLYNTAGFLSAIRASQLSTFMVGRVDHDFGDKNRFFASYRYFEFTNLTTNQTDIGGGIPGDTLGVPAATAPRPQKPSFMVFGLTSNLTSSITNDFRFNYTRNWWQWSDYTPTPGGQLAGMGGMLEIGGETSSPLIPYNVNNQSVRQRFWDGQDKLFRDDLTQIHGNHLFQFGGSYQRNYDYHSRTDNGGTINGELVYTSQAGITQPLGSPYVPASITTSGQLSTYQGYYAEALGIVQGTQVVYSRSGAALNLQPLGTPAFDQSIIPYYNVYWGDTWHVKPTLTVVYGLAYALEMPPYEINGKQVALVDTSGNPVSVENYIAARETAALQGQAYNPELGFATVRNVGSGLKYPYNPFYGQFSPRIAAAWNPSFSDGILGKVFGQGKTVIRGSYGRIYGRINGVSQVLAPLLSPGLLQGATCTNAVLSNGTCGTSAATNPLTAFRIGPTSGGWDGLTAPIPPASATLPQPDFPGFNGQPNGGDALALDPNYKPTRTDNFNFSIQRQIGRKMQVDIGYIGRITKNDLQAVNLDSVPTMFTEGGQQFKQAWANAYIGICGLSYSCASNPVGGIAAQPFFESALGGATSAFCKGFASCTQAVLANSTMLSAIKTDSVSSLWKALNSASSWVPGQTMLDGNNQANSVYLYTSLGYSNYNGGYLSYRVGDYHGLTLQSNFTLSHALGTAAVEQSSSVFTALNPYDLGASYGNQSFDVHMVYNLIMYYQPPFFKAQKGVVSRLLGGWTISPLFTAQSGSILGEAPSFSTTTCSDCQAFGEATPGSSVGAYYENAMLTGPLSASVSRNNNVAYNTTAGVNTNNTTGMNAYADPATVIKNFRPCILGYDTSCGGYGYLRGFPTWNLDGTAAKDFSLWKDNRVGGTMIFQITNVLNHMQVGSPTLSLGSPSTFGKITGGASTPRNMEFGVRIHF